MNFTTKTIAGSLFLLMSAGIASGGELTANLQKVISESDGVESIPVIVRFSDKLNIRKLRNEVERSLVSRGLDKRARKSERKRSKRVAMVNGLKKKNRAAKRLLKKYLRMYGEQPGMKALWAINAVATDIPAYLLDDLAGLPGIESITHNAVLNAPGTGIPTTQPNLWNLDMINAPQVWNQTLNTGQGVVVGIMDTGVDISNSDINARWRSANGWFDPYGQNPTPADVNGHGTQVAGLIVGGDNGGTGWQVGVAPGAQWIGAKIFDNTDNSTLAAIHQGYQWMLDPDDDPATTSDIPDIVNNSWSLENTTNQCVNEFSQDIALLKEAGVAVVFSAGNYGDGLGDTSVSPPNDPQVVSVGSVSDTYAISDFSSQGPSACDGGFFPHLVAPGENVLTYGLGELSYWSVSGTSFAAPHVSGILALLKSAFPDATVSELETAIVSTASDLGVAGADDTFGYGLVDALAAYQSLSVPAPLPGELQFNAATYSADENAGNLLVTVSRGGGSDGAVSVSYQTTDGTAVAGQDYQAASGTLDFADGEVSRTISISILDDTVYEVDEAFTLSLSNPTGGAVLGTQTNASVTLLDDDPLPPVDVDADGFSASLDCNDNDASIYPGAAEIVGDGVDQDCNGHDLTISIDSATYDSATDFLFLRATSDLGSTAALQVRITHSDGSSQTRNMVWKADRNRWQLGLGRYAERWGIPDSVTVFGPEGETGIPVKHKQPVAAVDADNDGHTADLDCNDNDASIYPGAVEIAGDGIDQDCNGHDLTIAINSATYDSATDFLFLWAISDLGITAALQVRITHSDGSSQTRNMVWKADKNRWQLGLGRYAERWGIPDSVTVFGPEGETGIPVKHKQPVVAVDADNDGHTADLDCNDNDASIYPGAVEIVGDGIDQDCNGHDLTIAINSATYDSATDFLFLWATSDLGSTAALQVRITHSDGSSQTRNMVWKADKNRWQLGLGRYAERWGIPDSVTVFGPEGEAAILVKQKQNASTQSAGD